MYRMDACPNCATLRRENDDLKHLVENLSSELAGHIGSGSNEATTNAICDGIADAISSEPETYNVGSDVAYFPTRGRTEQGSCACKIEETGRY